MSQGIYDTRWTPWITNCYDPMFKVPTSSGTTCSI